MRTMRIEKIQCATWGVLVLLCLGGIGAGWLLLPTGAAEPLDGPQRKEVHAAAPPAAGATQEQGQDAILQLKKKLVVAAQKTFGEDLARFRNGQLADPERLGLWSRRWLDASLDLSTDRDARLAAYRAHVERTREVAKVAKNFAVTGQGRISDATAAEYFLIQAEMLLEQAKANRK